MYIIFVAVTRSCAGVVANCHVTRYVLPFFWIDDYLVLFSYISASKAACVRFLLYRVRHLNKIWPPTLTVLGTSMRRKPNEIITVREIVNKAAVITLTARYNPIYHS